MAGLAALLMTGCMVAMHIVAAAGLADQRHVLWWTVASAAGLTLVLVLIRTGVSQRFADPSLTLFQILYAIACNAVAYVIAGPARGIAPPILAVILMFGMFGLSPRQMTGVMFYAFAAFGLAGLVVEWRQEPGHSQALSLAYATMFLVVVISSTFLTRRVQATRAHLRQQRHELALALEQIRELATHDDLTGLPNRRHMLELMRLEVLRAERSGLPLLLVQLDVDHFKTINDTHGHAVGDLALQTFARTVRDCVRASDVLARWGGEEFVLMLCNTQPADASELLERVRRTVAALRMERPGKPAIRLTVSIGVTAYLADEAIEQTLERADKALYAAKARGRDCIVWGPDVPAAQTLSNT
ncbi:MAG: GGDEF domain-containing protein [Comamonadaceae bacterium]|nr:MAG: GGDEF domain-containing protein [Comamonadaceae bacterium]